jgi:phage gpG-like protein
LLRLSISVEGEAVFDRAFNRVEKRIENMQPVWEGALPTIFEIFRKQFASEGSSGESGQWPALSPVYEEQKARDGYNFLPILQREQRLVKAFTQKGAQSQVLDMSAQELQLGTALPYAALHQRGTRRLKQRKIIDFSEKSKREIQKAIQRQLVDYVRAQGFIADESNFMDIG